MGKRNLTAKLWALLLLASMLLSLTACASTQPEATTEPPTEVTTEATEDVTTEPSTVNEETTEPEIIETYPLNVDNAYSEFATDLPGIIFKTTGQENGLVGSIYTFEGTLQEIVTYTDKTGTYVYEDATILTESGTVQISNLFKSIYNAAVAELGKESTDAVYSDDVNDYVLPDPGVRSRFVVVYLGYSLKNEMPVFILGASKDVFEIAGLDDPLDNKGTSGEVENNSGTNYSEPTDSKEDTPSPTEGKTDTPEESTTNPVETTQATTPSATVGEQNALKAAKNYLSIMPFSREGLINQLEYEGYTNSEVTYAVENCGADWNEQAVKSAKNYLNVSAFSRSGLIGQLEYEGFTSSQAEYGVANCGANWNEQAVRCAKAYLDIMTFSREGLIQQLEYEGFTHEQAVYGVEQNGL